MLIITGTAFAIFHLLYSIVKNLSADVYQGVKDNKDHILNMTMRNYSLVEYNHNDNTLFFLLFSAFYLTPYYLC